MRRSVERCYDCTRYHGGDDCPFVYWTGLTVGLIVGLVAPFVWALLWSFEL
jgi:hypothetical protein